MDPKTNLRIVKQTLEKKKKKTEPKDSSQNVRCSTVDTKEIIYCNASVLFEVSLYEALNVYNSLEK